MGLLLQVFQYVVKLELLQRLVVMNVFIAIRAHPAIPVRRCRPGSTHPDASPPEDTDKVRTLDLIGGSNAHFRK